MKIALIRPYYHTHLITPQLGLGYLSSYLRSKDISTTIIDGLNEELPLARIAERCKDYKVVGITCLTDYFQEVVWLSRLLKNQNQTVIVGGPHATALPRMTLEDTGADYVIVGEGEETLYELLKFIEDGHQICRVPGVVAAGNDFFVSRNLIENIDDIPFPDWELMDPRGYQKAPHGAFIKQFPVAPIISTRGCPFSCTFCASPLIWGKKIRFRSPENIVDEIEYLVAKFGVREIHFEDDNLTLKRSHITAVCEQILARNIRISWAAPNGVRADTLDRELLTLMQKSGCYFLAFGLESGSQNILNNVRKDVELETLRNAISQAGELGIITQGFFIFGLPGETEATIKETINFSKNSNLDRAQFLLLDVLPGSQLWTDLKGEFDVNFNRRSYQEVMWTPPGVDREVLSQAPVKAFRSFFFRPKQFFKLIRYMRPSQIKFIIRRVKDFSIF